MMTPTVWPSVINAVSDIQNNKVWSTSYDCWHTISYLPQTTRSQRIYGHESDDMSTADSRFVPSQWETALICNDVSHWLGPSLQSALMSMDIPLYQELLHFLSMFWHYHFYFGIIIIPIDGFCFNLYWTTNVGATEPQWVKIMELQGSSILILICHFNKDHVSFLAQVN